MLKIAVYDDSRTDMEMLERAFDKLNQYPVEYDVYFRADELIKKCEIQGEIYHLYIFGMKMPGVNGLDLAKRIRAGDEKALFVFLTDNMKYILNVFDVITFDYLLKPITEEKLGAVLWKAMRHLNMIKQDFVFQFRKNQFRVNFDDILYFEKNGRQAVIHTVSDNYRTNMTIKELWEQLSEQQFVHIHVSYIVNLSHIRAIKGNEVVLDNGETLFVARSHRHDLRKKHMEFAKRNL